MHNREHGPFKQAVPFICFTYLRNSLGSISFRAVASWVVSCLATCRIDFSTDLIYLLTTWSAYSINTFYQLATTFFRRNMRVVELLMMPYHTFFLTYDALPHSSSSLEGLLTGVQCALSSISSVTFGMYKYNMHTRYSNLLVYKKFGI